MWLCLYQPQPTPQAGWRGNWNEAGRMKTGTLRFIISMAGARWRAFRRAVCKLEYFRPLWSVFARCVGHQVGSLWALALPTT